MVSYAFTLQAKLLLMSWRSQYEQWEWRWPGRSRWSV